MGPSHSSRLSSLFQSCLIFLPTTFFVPCSFFCFVGVRLPLPSFGIIWHDWKLVKTTFYCIDTEKTPRGLNSGGTVVCQPLLDIAVLPQRHFWSSSWTSLYVGTSGGVYVIKILVLFEVRSDILPGLPAHVWKKDVASGVEAMSGVQLFLINQHPWREECIISNLIMLS